MLLYSFVQAINERVTNVLAYFPIRPGLVIS